MNTPTYTKRGPKRSLKPEREYFLLPVQLGLGLSEGNISYKAGISTSHFQGFESPGWSLFTAGSGHFQSGL